MNEFSPNGEMISDPEQPLLVAVGTVEVLIQAERTDQEVALSDGATSQPEASPHNFAAAHPVFTKPHLANTQPVPAETISPALNLLDWLQEAA